MKKNKLIVFLFGVVTTVSSVLIVVSILIASGAAGLDSLFTDRTFQASLPEMEKNEFRFTGNTGELSVSAIQVVRQPDNINVILELATNTFGIEVSEIRYEIVDNGTSYSGTAGPFDSSFNSLKDLSSLDEHTLIFSVWQDFGEKNPPATIRLWIYYKNVLIDPNAICSCVAETTY